MSEGINPDSGDEIKWADHDLTQGGGNNSGWDRDLKPDDVSEVDQEEKLNPADQRDENRANIAEGKAYRDPDLEALEEQQRKDAEEAAGEDLPPEGTPGYRSPDN